MTADPTDAAAGDATAAELPVIEQLPSLPPKEAIEFFQAKGYLQGFAWQDVWEAEHARAFTVAKMMDQELLEVTRAAVDAALRDGATLETFRANLRPVLEAAGWWGRKAMTDPLTGETVDVQLGSPRRLRIIFDVNMRTSYAAGRWARAAANAADRPYLRYVAVMDDRTRPEHRAWHGTILPIDHPWWDQHFPPCGWNCRCTTSTLDQATIDRRGWRITEKPVTFAQRTYLNPRSGVTIAVPGGIDPGFGYNVGKAYLRGQTPPLLPAGSVAAAAFPAEADAAPVHAAIGAFLAAFGLGPDEEKVFVDAAGYPLAIGPTLFVDAAGRLLASLPDRLVALAAAGRVVAEPTVIRWIWLKDATGVVQLYRRYLGQAGKLGVAADFGRSGWRFTTPAERAGEVLSGEALAWQRPAV